MNDIDLSANAKATAVADQPAPAVASAAPFGKVLLLGNDDRVLLAVARSLGRRGVSSHLAWHRATSLARHSRYIARCHQLPPYDRDSDAWLQALREAILRYEFDLVIPCNESTVVPLQRHRAELNDLQGIYLLDQAAFDVVFSKPRSTALAAELGIAVPRTMENDGTLVVDEVIERLGLPVMIKPRATFKNQQHAHLVRRIDTSQQLQDVLRSANQDEAMLVQECFVGTGVGVELLAFEGDILAAFQHQRLHESIEYGSSYRKSVPLDPELLEASRKLMAALRYTGVAMIEFIMNLETRRWVFLEINGRFWGSLPLAVAAGADFPSYLYQMLVLGQREFPQTYRLETYSRNLLLDFQGLKTRSRSNGLPRRVSLWTIAEDLATVLRGHDHIDNFSLDDPLPGVIDLGRIVSQFTRKMASKLSARCLPQRMA
jgi:predicted ATP-grasp superfamily ATP-dependent carboligase